MKPKELLEILSVAEKLKCNTRHCYTSSGRRESVAEHSWRISLMAMLLTKEFPEADMMNAMETQEAKIYKALDKMEAVIQHNESDISTWLPLEYDLQLTYGEENVQFSPYMQQLKAEVNDWTRKKIAREKPE